MKKYLFSRSLTILPLALGAILFASPVLLFASPAENCHKGLCDIFRLSVNAVGGAASANAPNLPRGDSPNILVPLDAMSPTLSCSKIVRVPEPVYRSIMITMKKIAAKNYLSRISDFTPQEQIMLQFFHTIIIQARGIGRCGGQ